MPKPHPILGEGDDAQRLRALEMLVSDHEADLTAAGRDVQALFARGRRIGALEVKVGEHSVIIKGTAEDVQEVKAALQKLDSKVDAGFAGIRTTFRTATFAVIMAAIAFAGLAVTIATQVPR
jgi:hypothetical protein